MPDDTTADSRDSVRVRMYRHGLGDCFLLRFPRPDGKPFHLVIDSGVIKGTQDPTVRMREVAEDIERETEGTIDALVVTHEHWDHVSGFTEAREVWERMKISEIWLAWTEDPNHALARKLRKDREARKAKIKTRIAALAGRSSFQLDGARRDQIDALLGFMGFGLGAAGANGSGTKEALDFITGQAQKPPLFLKPGDSFVPQQIPQVRIYVLGPPDDADEKLIKKSDPSKARPEVYSDPAQAFAFSGLGQSDDADDDLPFGPDEGDDVADVRGADAYLKRHFSQLFKSGANPAWRRLDFEGIKDLERLALALDGDTNNTSLALAIELKGGRVLLFPADAQVGNWLSWHNHIWRVGRDSVKADDLLKRTVLYKVGHHGSHNATLKDQGLEKMTHRDLIALIPVNLDMAKKKRWKMPFQPLHDALLKKTRGRVILADAETAPPKAQNLKNLNGAERKRFEKMVTATELFIDITL